MLRPLRALREALAELRRRPRLPLAFSAAACALHLLGWGLFAAGAGLSGAVPAALLRLLGVLVYAGSLIWLVEGLTRIALAATGGSRPGWRELCRWHGRISRDVALGLLNSGLAMVAAALGGFMAWSLALVLMPALALPAALLGLAAVVVVGLSQLFNACLVLDRGLSPSRAFTHGFQLLARHWPALLGLTPLLGGILTLPFAAGLAAAAASEGLGVVTTAAAMICALPVLATTIGRAFRQLEGPESPETPPLRGGR